MPIRLLLFVSSFLLSMQTLIGQVVSQEMGPPVNWSLVNNYDQRARSYGQQSDWKNALYYSLKAKEYVDQLGHEQYELTTRVYQYLYEIYKEIAKREEAITTLKDGLALALDHPSSKAVDIAHYYLQLATELTIINEISLAIEYLQKALSLINQGDQEVYVENRDLPNLYMELGKNYLNLQKLDQAEEYYRACYELMKEREGKWAAKMTISSIIIMGSIYARRAEYEPAFNYYAIADSLLSVNEAKRDHPDFFKNEIREFNWCYGMTWKKKGEKEKATECLLRIAEDYPIPGHWMDMSAYFYIGIMAEKEDDLKLALSYNQKAIMAACYTFDTPDYFQLPAVEDFREMGSTYWILNQKAIYLSRSAALTKDSVEKALYYSAALEVMDLFDQLHGQRLKKVNMLRGGQNTSLFNISRMTYRTGLSVVDDFLKFSYSEGVAEKGFFYTQKIKAQQLWLALLDSEATGFGKIPTALLQKEEELLGNIQRYEQKLLDARQAKDSVLVDLYKNQYLFESRRSYHELIRKMELEYPEYYESKYTYVVENSNSLKEILRPGELLIDYTIWNNSIFIHILGRDQPLQVLKIPFDDQTVSRVASLNKLLQSASWMRDSKREKLVELSHHLYLQLLNPIKELLEGRDRLIIIGDGITNYIPFEILLSSNTIQPYTDLDYLIRDYDISYHYSVSLFAKVRRKVRKETGGLFAFAPVYESPGLLGTSPSSEFFNATLRAYNSDGSYAPLPESEREAKAIMDLFSEQDSAYHFLALKSAAAETTLKTHLRQPYQFVHIAGHSFADLDHPRFSGIACYPSSEKDQVSVEDGTLYAGEIYNISTQADLVTLSSCESGFGKLEVSEGVLGLNRAFIYAGANNVIFSLWKVYDSVNAQLMVDLYQNILAGNTYASSLRQAKLRLLEDEVTAAPHYWAPYMLIGR